MFSIKFELSFGKDKGVKKDNTVEKYRRQQQQKNTRAQQEDEEFGRIKGLVIARLDANVDRLSGDCVPISVDGEGEELWILHGGKRKLRIQFIALHRKITFVKTAAPIPFNQTVDIQSPENLHRFGDVVDGAIDDKGIESLVDKAVSAAIDVQPGF